jgi:DNA invertase Pin-like site-specific DNA recombinase
MANALTIRKDQLPRSQIGLRAAQYVRMSTDHQRYSIENQAVVIAAYAQARNLTIVRTYSDKGESGLKLRNRDGLIQLLNDVQSGQVAFSHILVFDVSRWGRFQDIDESAHYEFICKQAGIKIAYCAEQFDNDGSLISSIVKNLKRVMAAEFSRELSAKVHAGQCRFASLGFKLGGRVGYALRRELVDANQKPKGQLKDGDRKYLNADHVRVRPGSPDEVAVVNWIFEQFERQKSETAIARELNRRAVLTSTGKPWNRGLIGRLLRNENYVGNLVFNRRSYKLRETQVYNPAHLWVRSEGCIEPIVERDVFLRAKKIIEERRVILSEEEMLARLRRTLMKTGRLSPAIIDRTVGLPCTATYMQHFGSLRSIYRLIGYTSKRNCEYIDSREAWADQLANLASRVAARIKSGGGRVAFNVSTDCLQANGPASISFRIARWCPGKRENHSSHWSIQCRARLAPGWIVAIRLGEHNVAVLDYLLLPTTGTVGLLLRFSEKARPRHEIRRFATSNALIRSISACVARADRSSATKLPRSSTRRTASRSKNKVDRAPHL